MSRDIPSFIAEAAKYFLHSLAKEVDKNGSTANRSAADANTEGVSS